jgi:hypothetical protein
MVGRLMNWKGLEWKRLWPSRYSFAWGGLGKNTENIRQASQCPERDLNRTPAEYKVRGLSLDHPAQLTFIY